MIPLLSLIALWAYAAVSTVGGAIANKNDNTLNQEIGAPIAALVQALQTEGADTFVWQSMHALYQSAHGHLPASGGGDEREQGRDGQAAPAHRRRHRRLPGRRREGGKP